jgi:hypothetical protein
MILDDGRHRYLIPAHRRTEIAKAHVVDRCGDLQILTGSRRRGVFQVREDEPVLRVGAGLQRTRSQLLILRSRWPRYSLSRATLVQL